MVIARDMPCRQKISNLMIYILNLQYSNTTKTVDAQKLLIRV
jgi:hypothetical protein